MTQKTAPAPCRPTARPKTRLAVVLVCLGGIAVGAFWLRAPVPLFDPQKMAALPVGQAPAALADVLPNGIGLVCFLGPYSSPANRIDLRHPALGAQLDPRAVDESRVRVAAFDAHNTLVAQRDFLRGDYTISKDVALRLMPDGMGAGFCDTAATIRVMVQTNDTGAIMQVLR